MNKTKLSRNRLFYLRTAFASAFGILCLVGITGLFYPVRIFDIQFTALAQRILVDFSLTALILLSILLLTTLIFGRVYCSVLCPFGLFQEFLMFIFRRPVAKRRNRPYKYLLAAVVFGILAGGTAVLIRLIDPYALFGSAADGAWIGITAAVIITILVFFAGRFFCSHICPVGTVLGLLSRRAHNKIFIDDNLCISCGLCASSCPTASIDFQNKSVNNETCIKCFRCLGTCRRHSIYYGVPPKAPVPFSPARRRLLIGGGIVAAFALAAKSGIELSRLTTAKIKKAILPAGAGNAEDFANRCLNCNLCVQNCPMKIIKKASADYPVVHIDYGESFCDYDCRNCSSVCPSGAIRRLSLPEKQKTQIGIAAIDENICIKCGLCVMKCPRQIIRKENGGFPQISADECIGCGACRSACPVKAINISAVDRQKILEGEI